MACTKLNEEIGQQRCHIYSVDPLQPINVYGDVASKYVFQSANLTNFHRILRWLHASVGISLAQFNYEAINYQQIPVLKQRANSSSLLMHFISLFLRNPFLTFDNKIHSETWLKPIDDKKDLEDSIDKPTRAVTQATPQYITKTTSVANSGSRKRKGRVEQTTESRKRPKTDSDQYVDSSSDERDNTKESEDD
jgi:hypothetical protein